uniref:Serpin domain-containing protein n=1 Tax=Spermophilus dauricus TaxID=99837 RepID=A0A8C9UW12_SPEDA
MDSLSKANGTFAIQVLKMLCQDRPSQNVFFSPLSISSALAMVLLGAKGNTKDQMAMSLNTEEDIHKGFQMLLTQVNMLGSKYLLTTANRLFGEKTYDFLSVNLISQPLSGHRCDVYSPWVQKKQLTEFVLFLKGKIPELLSMGSIDEQTRLVLVNAIYFQGTWEETFDKACTTEMTFKRDVWPVQMMWQQANFNFIYISEAQAKVLELPYAGKELSMIILLPDEDSEYEPVILVFQVENNLTFEKFIAWTKAASLQNTEVEVFLPRFKLQEDYEMKSVLQRLGMVNAFQPGQAELCAMSTETDLCLSKVVHKSVVEVNEKGTEAVVGTAVNIVLFGSSCKPTFCADHPFLFFIRHNETNTVLFCGRFSSP